MTVYFNKARQRWVYSFVKGGRRYSSYCLDAEGKPVSSRSAALQAEGVAKRRAAIAGKVARPGDYTLAQAIADMKPIWQRQDDWKNKRRYIRELLAFFGPATAMADISEARIQDYIGHALAQPVRVWTGGPAKEGAERAAQARKSLDRLRSPATVNLYLHLLRQAIGRATKVRDGLTGEPAVKHPPKIPVLKTMKRRARPVPDDVLLRILELVRPHVRDAIRLTLYFGLRQSEAFGLQVHQIDFAAGGLRLYAEGVKDSEDAFLPGSAEAMATLREMAAQARDRGVASLIAVRRNGAWCPIHSPKRAWETAMLTIQREFGRTWRWHDIRAAYITHVAMTSGPVMAQSLARHSDYETTRGYIEVADEMRREAARRAGDRPALAVAPIRKVS
jgi:integrase